MKYLCQFIPFNCFLTANMVSGQSITFNACHPFFDNQDFTFSNVGTNATGRNIFETIPITGDEPCSGLGFTSLGFHGMMLAFNGAFGSTNLWYYNTSASIPNPPSLALGTWVENTTVTLGTCGGEGTASIGTLSGEVQDDLNVLKVIDAQLNASIEMYPNPGSGLVYLRTNEIPIKIEIFDLSGKLI